MRRNTRYRRRRRARLRPAHMMLLLAAVIVCVFGFRRLAGGREPPPAVKVDGGQSVEPEAPSSQEPLPANVVTASGIACTRRNMEDDALYTGELILVNNKIFYHFPEDQELDCIYDKKSGSYYVRDREVFLAPVAMDALNRMLDAFMDQGGSKSINVVAGYRTEEFQQHLFDQSAERNGLSHAEKYVAKPGGSEHHTGLVVDLSVLRGDGSSADYDGTGEYAWINGNCHEYGYIVRYETGKEDLTGIWDEPWHFRYVGVPHATAMAEGDLCLEEYIDELRRYPFEGEHLTVDCADGTYEIWYCQGTEAYLPDSGDYQVSGNNVDGFVVTYKVS